MRKLRVTRLAFWLPLLLLVACSVSPPKYHLNGDACDAVDGSTFATLTNTKAPSNTTSDALKQGLQGGNCVMYFTGPTGDVTLTTFIAIHNGDQSASAMYEKFHSDKLKRAATHDIAPANQTFTDLGDLGTAAYLYREYYKPGEWDPAGTWLYEFGVRHGTLVITITAAGIAIANDRWRYAWPKSEQDFENQVRDVLDGVMIKLAQ